jgi:type IV pilus assembly protein PilM
MGYGIDIGSTAVKVVALSRTLAGTRVTGVSRRRVSQGQKSELLRLLHDALGPPNGRRVGVVGLSGRDINLQLVQQPAMKPLNYRVMMGYELDQRKGQATDIYLDYCTLREPDQFFPQYLALIGIGKSAYVDDRIDLAVRADLDVRDAVPNSFALFAAYRNGYESEGGTVLLLDIGSDNMDMAFVRGGRLIFARNISSGSRLFDVQIAGAMGTDGEKSEALKIARANLAPSITHGDEEDAIRAPVRSAAGQLASFISSSINHAKMQLNDKDLAIDKLYLSGGGSRLRGLPEYLVGALKIPVEPLDPFRKIDTSAVDRQGGEMFRALPTDMAVAIGLAQLVFPSPGMAASTLSILPDQIKRRRNFLRAGLWLGVAAGVIVVVLALLTGLAWFRKAAQQSRLEEFTSRTVDVKRRIAEMNTLDREQRELAAKIDSLGSHITGGRVTLDTILRLKKSLVSQIAILELRMVDPSSRKEDREVERTRAAFTSRRRGLMVGEVEIESDGEIQLKGQTEGFRDEDIVDGISGGVIRWPAAARVVMLSGEVDESVRGGPLEALKTLCHQLTDASRGVMAAIKRQWPSDKPGRRRFDLEMTFE